ncbi:riboflavin biosynthesis protein RibF [Methylobacterium sp. Leaf399]|uniref:bifunctional riboflavin kinase/FAD synthetase n=1 Tax=unclassified Methylobacterium TaxID=2615210 RepID=UPI0006FE80D7|nr:MULTISPECIES: bifunctional riboflavin kinase/FAD synthetase [unclassified Methylobacterium]KQP58191.1 riboflavin biosynthesis protein RibF [Methylobacterium sp. Leaf108]KQT10046.1 riboflavin biosynthesis protein RibF [Methylobacterium sp. Leaf399]
MLPGDETATPSPGAPMRRAPFLVVREDEPVPAGLGGAVAAIGNFDGVHRGHRALVAAVRETAAVDGRPAVVLTFEPHPRVYFNPGETLFHLSDRRAKERIFDRLGLDGLIVRRFDAALAGTGAAAFVEGLLMRDLGLSGVVIGHDFHFGRGREGTPAILAALCAAAGLGCRIIEAVAMPEDPVPVSSSAIRTALASGDVARANALLGYRWFVTAEVRHGDKRGRTLGYPTANMALGPCGLAHGIYAVRAKLRDGRVCDGVASYGRRPTFDDGAPLLEVNLFDFSGDLYGQEMTVEFVAYLRGEERFSSAEALIARMDRDAAEARSRLTADRLPSML